MNVYAYVRNVNGDFENGIKIIHDTAKLIKLDVDKVYMEKSNGKFGETPIMDKMIGEIDSCVLLVPDTSDMYFDEELAVRVYRKINDKKIFLIDCKNLPFNNQAMDKRFQRQYNLSDWFKNQLIVAIERTDRMRKELPEKELQENIIVIRERISQFFALE